MKIHYTLSFHPDIQGDLQEIYSWYEKKMSALGEDFLQVFYSCTKVIIENPLQ